MTCGGPSWESCVHVCLQGWKTCRCWPELSQSDTCRRVSLNNSRPYPLLQINSWKWPLGCIHFSFAEYLKLGPKNLQICGYQYPVHVSSLIIGFSRHDLQTWPKNESKNQFVSIFKKWNFKASPDEPPLIGSTWDSHSGWSNPFHNSKTTNQDKTPFDDSSERKKSITPHPDPSNSVSPLRNVTRCSALARSPEWMASMMARVSWQVGNQST